MVVKLILVSGDRMPEIQIRPAIATDIPNLIALDHHYTSEYAWQMDLVLEEGQMAVNFRQIHLPRSVKVEYPRSPQTLLVDWNKRSGLLVAIHEDEPVGYIGLQQDIAPATTWVTDLVVIRRLRRQGIGSALVLASQDWARQHNIYRMVLEMQPKNFPAYCMAQKLGYNFCGYNDRYYANHDITLFFAKSLS
jgi:GNAT superfamily N-acetyltransferase